MRAGLSPSGLHSRSQFDRIEAERLLQAFAPALVLKNRPDRPGLSSCDSLRGRRNPEEPRNGARARAPGSRIKEVDALRAKRQSFLPCGLQTSASLCVLICLLAG